MTERDYWDRVAFRWLGWTTLAAVGVATVAGAGVAALLVWWLAT